VVEVDVVPESTCEMELIRPDGSPEVVMLTGTSTWQVLFEGPAEGYADDENGDGWCELVTELAELDLSAISSLGPILESESLTAENHGE